jgi:hypothetical protein
LEHRDSYEKLLVDGGSPPMATKNREKDDNPLYGGTETKLHNRGQKYRRVVRQLQDNFFKST